MNVRGDATGWLHLCSNNAHCRAESVDNAEDEAERETSFFWLVPQKQKPVSHMPQCSNTIIVSAAPSKHLSMNLFSYETVMAASAPNVAPAHTCCQMDFATSQTTGAQKLPPPPTGSCV